jgi:hypothetical protein
MEINGICCGCYAIHDTAFNFLHSVISKGDWHKVMNCNGDDAIAHATQRIQTILT